MAKRLSCYKGYAGLYEYDKDTGVFEGSIYRYGYPYRAVSYFRAEKEDEVELKFKMNIKNWLLPADEDLYPYTSTEKPLSDKDVVKTPKTVNGN